MFMHIFGHLNELKFYLPVLYFPIRITLNINNQIKYKHFELKFNCIFIQTSKCKISDDAAESCVEEKRERKVRTYFKRISCHSLQDVAISFFE